MKPDERLVQLTQREVELYWLSHWIGDSDIPSGTCAAPDSVRNSMLCVVYWRMWSAVELPHAARTESDELLLSCAPERLSSHRRGTAKRNRTFDRAVTD